MTKEELQKMSESVDDFIQSGEVVDIESIHIDVDSPMEQRANIFFTQINNPYCFRSGDIIVKLKFSKNSKTLDEKIKDFFINRKNR